MNVSRARNTTIVLWSWVCLFGVSAVTEAQEPLVKAKALYDSAAYEEALAVLAPVDALEAQQYKALCMLALGRSQDAAAAVESLVSASPMFEPSTEDVPPRFVSLVTDAKRKLLPTLARRTFTEGREQFRNGDREDALRKFNMVLTLTSSPTLKDTPDADDLRTLAAGFIDLARATAPARPEAPTPTPEPAKVAESAPSAPVEVIQPVVIRQTVPPVPSEVVGRGGPVASVHVTIGPDGKVTAATMQQSAHPLYDRLLLQAAREWVYSPAMLGGRAVPSEKVVTIQIR